MRDSQLRWRLGHRRDHDLDLVDLDRATGPFKIIQRRDPTVAANCLELARIAPNASRIAWPYLKATDSTDPRHNAKQVARLYPVVRLSLEQKAVDVTGRPVILSD